MTNVSERLRQCANDLIKGRVEDGAVSTEMLCEAADEIERLTALAAQQDVREAVKLPHRTMTPEEYAALRIIGWHEVCKNVDLAGNVGLRYGGIYTLAEIEAERAKLSVEHSTGRSDGKD